MLCRVSLILVVVVVMVCATSAGADLALVARCHEGATAPPIEASAADASDVVQGGDTLNETAERVRIPMLSAAAQPLLHVPPLFWAAVAAPRGSVQDARLPKIIEMMPKRPQE